MDVLNHPSRLRQHFLINFQEASNFLFFPKRHCVMWSKFAHIEVMRVTYVICFCFCVSN